MKLERMSLDELAVELDELEAARDFLREVEGELRATAESIDADKAAVRSEILKRTMGHREARCA